MTSETVRSSEGGSESPARMGCCRGKGKWVWIVLVLAVVCVLTAKNAGKRSEGLASSPGGDKTAPAEEPTVSTTESSVPTAEKQSLPRLVDLGASACIPCRMMAPILEELKKEYSGVFRTEFIDVWQNSEAARRYGIRVIPTQIFFNAEGKEIFRHEGYFSKEDILQTWKRHGIDVTKK